MDSMKPKIFIGMPAYGGMVSANTLSGYLDLQKWFLNKGIEYQYHIITNESLITRARNEIVANMLNSDFKASHLLFIDADISFSHKNIERLIQADKDIVCGIYPSKNISWNKVKKAVLDKPNISIEELQNKSLNYNLNFYDDKMIKLENGFCKVKDAATGMMLIKTSVFYKLIEKFPEREYQSHKNLDKSNLKNCYDFFSVGVFDKKYSKKYLSEDYYFSRLWQSIGGEIWADLSMPLDHFGNYLFKGNVASTLRFK